MRWKKKEAMTPEVWILWQRAAGFHPMSDFVTFDITPCSWCFVDFLKQNRFLYLKTRLKLWARSTQIIILPKPFPLPHPHPRSAFPSQTSLPLFSNEDEKIMLGQTLTETLACFFFNYFFFNLTGFWILREKCMEGKIHIYRCPNRSSNYYQTWHWPRWTPRG